MFIKIIRCINGDGVGEIKLLEIIENSVETFSNLINRLKQWWANTDCFSIEEELTLQTHMGTLIFPLNT